MEGEPTTLFHVPEILLKLTAHAFYETLSDDALGSEGEGTKEHSMRITYLSAEAF